MSDFTVDAVVAGIGSPRIVEVGENKCTNPRLTTNTDGWESNNPNLNIAKIEDSDAYEEYMLRIYHSVSLYDYVKYTADIGQTISSTNKKILVAFRIKHTKGSGEIQAEDEIVIKVDLATSSTTLGSKQIVVNPTVKRISMIYEGNWSGSQTDVELRIYNGIDFQPSGDIRVDDVYINLVDDDWNFDCSQENFVVFNKVLTGQSELMDGETQEYNKRWRPNYFGHWQILNKQQEIFRQKVAEANKIFVFPHVDFFWGFFGLWDVDFERNYSFNKYIGHDSSISIKGNELLVGTMNPDEVQYIPPPVTYQVVIGSINPANDVLITLSVRDFNNQGNGYTEFLREYEEDTYVIITAPETVLDGTEEKIFSEWQDENGSQISTLRGIKVQITEDKEYYAVYETEDPPVSEGYGTDYGGSYGDVF